MRDEIVPLYYWKTSEAYSENDQFGLVVMFGVFFLCYIFSLHEENMFKLSF